MKIGTKVNLILIIIFISGIFMSGIALSNILEKEAENEVNSQALILMQMANSVRNYTNDRVQPLLLPKLDTQQQFIPEAIPSFASREVFENLHQNKQYANFRYKDAFLNPTNWQDKVNQFEADIVEQFRKEPDVKNTAGFLTISGERIFYSARPFIIQDKNCLRCHSTPEQAPKSQLVTYGKDNGFGWQLNQVLGSQIVYIPAEEIFRSASRAFFVVIGVIATIFTAIIIIINQLLRKTVLQRIKKIAAVAEQVSLGDMNVDFGKQDKDEIGNLAEAVNRMKYSLEIALNMLTKNKP